MTAAEMDTDANQDVLTQRVVDATIKAHGGIQATHEVRSVDLMESRYAAS